MKKKKNFFIYFILKILIIGHSLSINTKLTNLILSKIIILGKNLIRKKKKKNNIKIIFNKWFKKKKK